MTVREVSAKSHDEVRLELPRYSFENGPFWSNRWLSPELRFVCPLVEASA